MAKGKNRGPKNSKTVVGDYVTVAIAEDLDLANEYTDILAKSGIPAVAATQRSYSSAILGIAVMVPQKNVEQAQNIIESQQVFDVFLDEAFNDSIYDETGFGNLDYDYDMDDDF